MDIRSLIQFLQVAKDGSYTKAAASLYLVQPTLSKTIQNLEDELGVRLFQKNGQRIELTDHGERLLNIATPIVNQFQNIPAWLRENQEEEGEISIRTTPMLAELYLSSYIPDFYARYPNIKLKIMESNTYAIRDAVMRSDCEIGFCMLCREVQACGSLHIHPLFDKDVVVAIHKDNPLCRLESVSMGDLRNERFNLYSEGHAMQSEIYQRCSSAGFHPDINMSSSSAIFLLKLSESGNGITILPRPFTTLHAFSDLRIIPFQPCFPWSCGIITKKDCYQSHVVNLFFRFIHEKFKELT